MSLYHNCENCGGAIKFGSEKEHDCEHGTKQRREIVEAKARIASLESALGVASGVLSGLHADAQNALAGRKARDRGGQYVPHRWDHLPLSTLIQLEREFRQALSQPAMAQAAEKWKRMEAALEFYRDERNWLRNPNEACSAIIADTGTRAKNALDACEKEGVKRES